MSIRRLQMTALPQFPVVEPGDDLADSIIDCCARSELRLQNGDVLVLAQKIVSKSENRYVYLKDVEVGERARALAELTAKEPRLVQLILDESLEVLRSKPGVIVVEHRLGYVHANAGIDRSNIVSDPRNPRVLLLPLDPDGSALGLRNALLRKAGVRVGVIINDSAGRAWRNGTVGFALGTAGFEPLISLVGRPDITGAQLETTEVAVADELAAGASFLMGQADEATPAVLIQGAALPEVSGGSRSLIRERQYDMFR